MSSSPSRTGGCARPARGSRRFSIWRFATTSERTVDGWAPPRDGGGGRQAGGRGIRHRQRPGGRHVYEAELRYGRTARRLELDSVLFGRGPLCSRCRFSRSTSHAIDATSTRCVRTPFKTVPAHLKGAARRCDSNRRAGYVGFQIKMRYVVDQGPTPLMAQSFAQLDGRVPQCARA